MKKRTIATIILFAGCGALLIAFAVKTIIEWNYYTHTINSAPFSLFVIVNALGFIVPAAILAAAALFLLKKPKGLWIVGGACVLAAAVIALVCITDKGVDLGIKSESVMSTPVFTSRVEKQ